MDRETFYFSDSTSSSPSGTPSMSYLTMSDDEDDDDDSGLSISNYCDRAFDRNADTDALISRLEYYQMNGDFEDLRDTSCSIMDDGWKDKYHFAVDMDAWTDDPPPDQVLKKAGEVEIYDQDGKSSRFKDLYTGEEHQDKRQLVIFVRMFHCPGCQRYLRKLVELLTPYVYFTLSVPTTVTIISAGSPEHIKKWLSRTRCPFPVYADPGRKLYKTLGMGMSLLPGPRPEFMGGVPFALTLANLLGQKVMAGTSAFTSGPLFQIGGEFLFEQGKLIWCHKMRNLRNHTDIPVLNRLLDLDNNPISTDGITALPEMSANASAAAGINEKRVSTTATKKKSSSSYL